MKVVFDFSLKSCFVQGAVQKDKSLEAANKDLGWWEISLEQKALKYSVDQPGQLSSDTLRFATYGKAEKRRWVNSLTPQKPERVMGDTDNFSQDLCRSCCPKDPRYA